MRGGVSIDWQYRNGAHDPGSPNLAPTKNLASRDAQIWAWAYKQYLTPVLAKAAKRPGGLLFPLPPRLKAGKRRAQALYRAAMDAHGYPYTSHWHRATYITRNVAPPSRRPWARSGRRHPVGRSFHRRSHPRPVLDADRVRR